MKETRTRKSSGEKRSERKKRSEKQVTEVNYCSTEEHKIEEAFEEKKKKRAFKKSKKHHVTNIAESSAVGHVENEVRVGLDESDATLENKENKLRKKKRKLVREKQVSVDADQGYDKVPDGARENNAGKSKKARTIKKKDHLSTKEDENLLEKTEESKQEGVYEMSSGDEDCSRGMKKWIMEYRKSRLGLDILQERIDAFIEAHEEQEKKAREEREALAAEGGWTVVVHHKGRKKTTDAESGIAVGSVAQAAVLENMAKKKKNDVGLDFYRFQKRDAKRSEIMALQSKFEQDKKRIQQLRAARKFRPY